MQTVFEYFTESKRKVALTEDKKSLEEVDVMLDEPPLDTPDVPQSEFTCTNAFYLNEQGTNSLISHQCQTKDHLSIIKEKKKQRRPDDTISEHTIFAFELDRLHSPVFSYVLQEGFVPISIKGISILPASPSSKTSPVLFLVARDSNNNNRVCLQAVFVGQKKFRNLMYSKLLSVNDQDNFLRIKIIDNQVYLLFNVGDKFVFFAFKPDEPDWAHRLKDEHSVVNINPNNSINSEIVDFQFDTGPLVEGGLLVAFLCRMGEWTTLRVLRIYPKRDINKFSSEQVFETSLFVPNGLYSSVIFNSDLESFILSGLFLRPKTKKVSLNMKQVKFKKTDNLHLGTVESTSTAFEFSPAENIEDEIVIPLDNLSDECSRILTKNSDLLSPLLEFLSSKPVNVVTSLIKDPEEAFLITSSLFWVDKERLIYRVGQRPRRKLEVDKLSLDMMPDLAKDQKKREESIVALTAAPRVFQIDQSLEIFIALSNFVLAELRIRGIKKPIQPEEVPAGTKEKKGSKKL